MVYSKYAKNGKRYKPSMKRTYGARSTTTLAERIGAELKFQDSEANVDVLGTVAGSEADPLTDNALNAIVQGDADDERNGRQIRMKSIQIKGMCNFVEGSGAVPPTQPYLRVYMIRDKQTNGAQLNSEDVFVDPTNAELDVECFRNLKFIQRFEIVAQCLIKKPAPYTVWNGSTTKTNGANVPWSLYASMNDTVNFSASTGVVNSITDISYHLIMIGTANINCQNHYLSRVRFYG